MTWVPGQVLYCSNEQDYHDAIQKAGGNLVVVDCFAEWCPPCRAIAPKFEALAQQNTHVVFIKIDVDKFPGIKNILSIWAMPTFAFLVGGKVVGSFMGANESKLRQGIANNGNVGVCSSCCIS